MIRVIALAVLLAGCKSQAPAAHLDHTTKPQSPVQVSWQELSRDGTKAELVAQVKRLAPLTFPLEVTIDVPAGATLAAGRARFTLPPNAEGATHSEPVTLVYEKIPAADAVLHADGEAIDMGVHGRVAYRFGRPAPQHEVVAPTGPAFRIGDRDVGPSIPISPQ